MGNNEDEMLAQKISDVDKEIIEIENGLKELKKKEFSLISSLQALHKGVEGENLREAFVKAQCLEFQKEDPEVEYRRRLVERFSYKNSDTIKRIYNENREKANKSHSEFNRFNYSGKELKLPLYSQPSDLAMYHDNIEKYKSFRPKLLMFLQKKCKAEIKLEKHLQREYEEHKNNWINMVEKMETNPKRKQKQQRARQFYEREFPEIKKHREQQERFDRLGSRSVGYIRSEAEVEEIADNLREKESSEKKMKLLAIMTPKLLNNYDRKIRYVNNNGLIKDVEEFEKTRQEGIIWSDKERKIFDEKYTQYPKWFERIASFLDVKSCADCVQFYYLNKKKQHFHSTKSKKKKGKLNRSVTMSMKLDQNKQKQSQPGKDDVNVELEEDDDDDSVHSEEENAVVVNTDVVNDTSEPSKPVTAEEENSAPPDSETLAVTEADKTNPAKPKPAITETDKTNMPKPKPLPLPQKVFNTRSGKFKSNPSTPTKSASASLDESVEKSAVAVTAADATHPPLKITIVVTSPSNTEGQTSAVSVVSIVSETVTAASMIAETTTTSMLPTSEEPSVPQFNVEDLIKTHLSKMPEHSDPSRWSEGEMLKAVEGLKRFGRNWQLVSKLVESKSEAQCKNFYFNYKKKFNLECILGISRSAGKDGGDLQEVSDEFLTTDPPEQEEGTKVDSTVEITKQEKGELKQSKSDVHTKGGKSKNNILEGIIESEESKEEVESIVYHNVSSDPALCAMSTPTHDAEPSPAFEESVDAISEEVKEVSNADAQSQDIATTENPTVKADCENQEESSPLPRPQPPPLVAHVSSPETLGDTAKSECSPIPEISLKGDIGLFERKLESSIDRETLLKVSSPNVPAAEKLKSQRTAVVNSKVDEPELKELKARRLRGSVPDLHLIPHSPPHSSMPMTSAAEANQFMAFHAQRVVRPPMFSGQHPPPRQSHPMNRFMTRCQGRSVVDQSVAMKAFNSYQGYVSSHTPTRGGSDVTSPRFNYPISPTGNAVEHIPMAHNMSQTRPMMQHSQHAMPVASNQGQSKSPGMNHGKGFGRHVDMMQSGMMQTPFGAHYSHEEVQKRREIEMLHQQLEAVDLNEMMILRDRETEANPQLRFRRQSELNFLRMKRMEYKKKLEYEKKLEEETKQMRFRQQQKLFAQKFLEHEAMSQEMVHSLVQRHFNFDEGGPVEKQLHGDACSQEEVMYAHDVRDKYLRHLPSHPRSRDEIQQRTAAIPNLRRNSLPEIYDGRDRMRVPIAEIGPDQYQQERLVNRLAHARVPPEHLINRMATQGSQERLGNQRAAAQALQEHLANQRTPPGSQERLVHQRTPSHSPHTGIQRTPSQSPQMGSQRTSQERLVYQRVSSKSPLDCLSNQRVNSQGPSQDRSLTQRMATHGSQEHLVNHMVPPQGQLVCGMPYDKFGDLENPNITIPQISLEPLSRPGSANSEFSTGSCPERVYGISTGLARKPSALSSITGSATLVSNEHRNESFSPDSHGSLSPAGRQNSHILPRVKTPTDKDSTQRRSAIVRPWEIGLDTSKSSHGAPTTPLIQLASTTKYKEQIISIAQKNSPAPQMFPKFHYRDGVTSEGGDVSNNGKEEGQTGAVIVVDPSVISSSPVVAKDDDAKKKTEPENNESFVIRPRSDSEETLSADESEVRDSVPSAQPGDAPAISSALLMQKLNAVTGEKNNSEQRENLSSVVVTINEVDAVPESSSNKVPSLKISSDKEGEVARKSSQEFESSEQIEVNDKNSLNTSIGDSQSETTNKPIDNLQLPLRSDKSNVEPENRLPPRSSDMVTSIVHSSMSCVKSKHCNTIPQNTVMASVNSAGNGRTANPLKAVQAAERHTGPNTPEKESKPESPDIYDDLKVHEYDEQPANSPFDLYSEIKSDVDEELIKLSTLKNSPNSEPDFSYAALEGNEEQDADEIVTSDPPVKDQKLPETDDISKQEDDEEVTKLTGGKQPSDFESRSDAGTPVMDEPSMGDSTVVTPSKQGDKSDPSIANDGSPPEARTPLLDEPEYHFEPVIPIMDATNPAYAQFNQQLACQPMPGETALSSSHARMEYMRLFGSMEPMGVVDRKREMFESITPPSSPENELRALSRKNVVSSAGQAVPFPYSALAFNVHSRPGSRAGSSSHSPLPPGERSPRNEKLDVAPRHRSKRSSERDVSPHLSHLDNRSRDFRRSGSQSSSSSFSKSPEYEYKQRRSYTDRKGDTRDSGRKHKRESGSPGSYEGSYSKRPRV